MPKIHNIEIRDQIKRQILADFADGVRVNMGPNPPSERIAVYKLAFDEITESLDGEAEIET